MQIVLPPELEQLVQHQIMSGNYQTAIDVIWAGVRLLERQSQQDADSAPSFGDLDDHLNFVQLTEAEMIQQSLEVLANYQQDAIPHDQVEAWIKSLDCPPASSANRSQLVETSKFCRSSEIPSAQSLSHIIQFLRIL